MPMCSRTLRRAIVAITGVAWIMLGLLSDNVPWFGQTFWVVLCTAAGGAAFALARYTTVHALKRYTAIVAVIGTLRGAAYCAAGAWGPMFVWVILISTTVAAALALTALNVQRGTTRPAGG